ncbi:hypothetical protein N7457_000909 [Penicillium paradoxum]|uniref:uncharacterized protein n=1 Tax=Penicillium paradoxum TaxID=176176 RepID=UPI0025491896|nr:uncharacterized protein N7457_000909 [Penicillium paradoxum]KAJ5794310.1 hypothetical protein N7457_000909 [Penicillium paradoxum]
MDSPTSSSLSSGSSTPLADVRFSHELAKFNPWVQTQATDLPPDPIIKIYVKAPMLTKPEQFEWWFANIERILRDLGLDSLVSSLPYPASNDPARTQWFELSKVVHTWLEKQVSNEILRKIDRRNPNIVLAHQFACEVQTLMQEMREWQVQNAHFAFYHLRRCDCSSIQEFVETAKERFRIAWDLDAGVAPWAAISLVARGITSVPETKCFYSFVDGDYPDEVTARDSRTAADFYEFCDDVLNSLYESDGEEDESPFENVLAFTVPKKRWT